MHSRQKFAAYCFPSHSILVGFSYLKLHSINPRHDFNSTIAREAFTKRFVFGGVFYDTFIGHLLTFKMYEIS